MNKLKRFWGNVRASFWFVPTLIVAFSAILALGLIEVDASRNQDWMGDWPRLFGAKATSASGMLATIAGSMMTVVGVVFSMTLVTLALASSQYTSRILRNFMSDHATQIVLGVFAGIFTYCLIVLCTIRGSEENEFVPSLSVAFSVVLAIGGIGTLIFFIHHIASSIQASNITASVAGETIVAIDRLFPENLGKGPANDAEDESPPAWQEWKWQAVTVKENGYIQNLDNATLLRVAKEQKTILRMERGIGEFVVRGTPLLSVAHDEPLGDDIITELQNAYGIDRHRTVEQDAGFGIRQLVDMALRSLSPGINDTTTAVMCVDYLTAILSRLATRDIPSSHRYEDGELRVIAIGPTFANLVGEAFDQIRGSSQGNLSIMLRMLGSLHTIGTLTDNTNRRRILGEHVDCIAEVGSQSIPSRYDRARFEERLSQVRASLGAERVPAPRKKGFGRLREDDRRHLH